MTTSDKSGADGRTASPIYPFQEDQLVQGVFTREGEEWTDEDGSGYDRDYEGLEALATLEAALEEGAEPCLDGEGCIRGFRIGQDRYEFWVCDETGYSEFYGE